LTYFSKQNPDLSKPKIGLKGGSLSNTVWWLISLSFKHGSQPEIKRFAHLAPHSLIKFLLKPAYFKYAWSLALN